MRSYRWFRHNLQIVFLSAAILFGFCGKQEKNKLAVNFSHLKHLTQTICTEKDTFDIVHIYSEFPDYHWVNASDEGVACVDDAARAAILYMRYFEISKDSTTLDQARGLLNFVVRMQTKDGKFYNFLHADTTINYTGKTSKKKFDFWAARGYWALGKGIRIFRHIDPSYSENLKVRFIRCKIPLGNILRRYPEIVEENGISYPTWLINTYGADATAEFLLGVNEFLHVYHDDELLTAAKKLVQGIILMQLQDNSPQSGALLSWKNVWHDWGNSQMQALSDFFEITKDSTIISNLKNEANFLARMLISGRIREFSLNGKSSEFPQIAYGIRCQAVGLLRLARITGEEKYERLAGLTASWFTGNNSVATEMYDEKTGRVFDGINSAYGINKNSGAESTIEGLLTILEISNNLTAEKFCFAKAIAGESNHSGKKFILPDGKYFELKFDRENQEFLFTEMIEPNPF